MSAQTVFAFVAALHAVTVAMPTDLKDPTTLDLATVMNKTVCPIEIEIDEDLNRIPKRIKVMKCNRDPNLWCSKMNIPKHECCQIQHDNVRLECVEVQDMVQVYYPARDHTQLYRVSVGCACVMEDAAELPAPQPDR